MMKLIKDIFKVMWKEIYSFNLNLLIGIISGIASGIIVSYAFLIESEYKIKFSDVKKLFKSVYSYTSLYGAYKYAIAHNKEFHGTINCLDKINGNIIGSEDCNIILARYWEDIKSWFDSYEPCKYSHRLGNITSNIYEMVIDGKYVYCSKSVENLAEINTLLENQIALFEECEKNYKQEVLILICNSKCMKIFVIIVIILIAFIFFTA